MGNRPTDLSALAPLPHRALALGTLRRIPGGAPVCGWLPRQEPSPQAGLGQLLSHGPRIWSCHGAELASYKERPFCAETPGHGTDTGWRRQKPRTNPLRHHAGPLGSVLWWETPLKLRELGQKQSL